MERISRITIEGYRSIDQPITITFPRGHPVVLVGENNARKSNIVKALQLVLGPFWPGNYEPEDHEFFGRNLSRQIKIEIDFDPAELLAERFQRLVWRYDPGAENPVYFRAIEPSGDEQHVKNEYRDACMCVVVEAERNLSYHLSYSSKWTLLSRLMHRFHRALSGDIKVRGDLENLFEQVKGKFQEVSQFRAFVESLREELGDLVGGMQHRLQVDFEAYNPVNFFHALRLQAVEGEEPRTLDEMGTGEQQILALALAYAYAKAFHGGIILVIEEPEAHLHPLAQQWLARRLRKRCAEGLQLIITTHSPSFVSMEGLEGLVLVYKEKGATRIRQLTRQALVKKCIKLGVPENRISEDSVLPFYAANATTDLLSGFFSRAVVLVEGPTEALALPVLLEKVGLDTEKVGIAILSVGGKGNLAKWYRLYTVYEIPCYPIFDNDSKDDEKGMKRKDALRAIGLSESEQDGVINKKGWVVEGRYTVFGTNFEEIMREYFADYKMLEEQARQQGIESKPFIARWVAEHLKENEVDEGWRKLKQMKNMLLKLLERPEEMGENKEGNETFKGVTAGDGNGHDLDEDEKPPF